MGTTKVGVAEGQPIHYSVGIILREQERVLLIDRNTPPYGLAGIAGHLEENEEPSAAIKREVLEETGLELVVARLIHEEFVPLNTCSRGIPGHYWYLFEGEVGGNPTINTREVKSVAWYSLHDLAQLSLEPVWRYWFEQLGLI